MYTIQPKKLLIVHILDILRKYTDAEHRLSQREIADILERDYNMKTDRKSVKRNLMNLIDFGYDIEYTEIMRKGKNREGKEEESAIWTDFYLNREFTDSELRMLIDGLLFAKHIPSAQCRDLIEKIKKLSSIYFEKKVQHIHGLPVERPQNKELLFTVDVIDEAIIEDKKVAFTYNAYGKDRKLHPKREREYIVNPYQMVVTNGLYYLICNYDKYDGISHYRMDKITGVHILDEPRKPVTALSEKEIHLPTHMAEHLYMFAGKSTPVKFLVKDEIIDQLADWFGSDMKFRTSGKGESTAQVKVNEEAFLLWAMQYGQYVEILEPQAMREEMKRRIEAMMEKYR